MRKSRLEGLPFSIAERRTLLIIGDIFVGILSLGVSLIVWATSSQEWFGFSQAFFQNRVGFWFYLLPLAWAMLLVEVYDVQVAANRQKTIQGVSSAAGIGFFLYLAVYFASQNPLPRIGVACFLFSVYILTLLWRLLYIRIFTKARFLRRVVLVGAGKAGKTILDVVSGLDPLPFNLIGIVDDDPDKQGTVLNDYPVIAGSDHLLEIIEKERISEIMVAISGEMKGQTFQNLLDAQHLGVEITRMPVAYEQLLNRLPIRILEADWILRSFVDQFQKNRFYSFAKRIVDIAGGLVGTVFLSLIFPFVGLAILLDGGRPIFYSQVRLGVGGKPFNIIKFRTMRQDAELNGEEMLAKEDDERATYVGRIFRKTHIDEMPQFLNVLNGDMSLVGPRSERPSLVEHYVRRIPFYRSRLLVKPGLTGWAQVNFGYAGSVEDTITKLEYDLYYIKHRSLALDFISMLRTPGTMLGMRGQ